MKRHSCKWVPIWTAKIRATRNENAREGMFLYSNGGSVAATKNGALEIGIERTTGTIQKGKIANLVLLSDDPTQNIDNIDKVELVIKNGRLYNE
jgi:predicted amidohydrolase YtcJ